MEAQAQMQYCEELNKSCATEINQTRSLECHRVAQKENFSYIETCSLMALGVYLNQFMIIHKIRSGTTSRKRKSSPQRDEGQTSAEM